MLIAPRERFALFMLWFQGHNKTVYASIDGFSGNNLNNPYMVQT